MDDSVHRSGLVAFDQFGAFEIVDVDLLQAVAAGDGAVPAGNNVSCVGVNTECPNSTCYNDRCENGACYGNGLNVPCL